jgi:hypothetical protein
MIEFRHLAETGPLSVPQYPQADLKAAHARLNEKYRNQHSKPETEN